MRYFLSFVISSISLSTFASIFFILSSLLESRASTRLMVHSLLLRECFGNFVDGDEVFRPLSEIGDIFGMVLFCYSRQNVKYCS